MHYQWRLDGHWCVKQYTRIDHRNRTRLFGTEPPLRHCQRLSGRCRKHQWRQRVFAFNDFIYEQRPVAHSRAMSLCRHLSRGFTLVELAVAMFIIALLLGSILVPLATQIEQRQISDTQKKQDEIKEALIGFALANGYLPCPAVSAVNGQEGSRTAGLCTPRTGFLPWEALGVSRADGWGRLYRYSVTPTFADNTNAFKLNSGADITVRTRDSAGALVNLTNSSTVPAIVISHGKNGYGGTSESGTGMALPTGWPA